MAKSIFGRDEFSDPSGIKIKREGIPVNPGSKAVGFPTRANVRQTEKDLALNGSIEPGLSLLLWEIEIFFDLSGKRAMQNAYELRSEIDVVVCKPNQIWSLEADRDFVNTSAIVSKGVLRMLIYTRPQLEMPVTCVHVRNLDSALHEDYAWTVSLR